MNKKQNNRLGLYAAYYLARFNNVAYNNLGYGNQLQTHIKIGEILDIKPATIKNWRDEFDPLFGNRVGWYQRPLSLSRKNVAEALEFLSENDIKGIVKDILKNHNSPEAEELQLIISRPSINNENNSGFVSRHATGKAAESFFIEQHKKGEIPFFGKLHDHRDLGGGYDFMIQNGRKKYYLEVKGISHARSGILFTSKEWAFAQQKQTQYILCIVSDVDNQPCINYICNPSGIMTPHKNILTTIQISWSVSPHELEQAYDNRLFKIQQG